MIVLRSLFFEICIDPNQEYVIYHTDYMADIHGNPLPPEEKDPRNMYEYGDIFIETPKKRYKISKIPNSAYEWVSELLNYIDNHRSEDTIFVDLYKLIRVPGTSDDYEEFYGTLSIEPLDTGGFDNG